MEFLVGIETPRSDSEGWGSVVPVFSLIGYGCFSASGSKEEILTNTEDVILSMVDEAIREGRKSSLSKILNGPMNFFEGDYEDFDVWLTVDVDLEGIL